MLTTTKAQFRRNIARAKKPVKPVDPNKRLTKAQLQRMAMLPGRIQEQLDEVREKLQYRGTPANLARARKLREQYLEAQIALATALRDKEYSDILLKIKLSMR